jgi:hypothetical protein
MSQQINLFNPVFLKQKKYFSVLAMAQALGLIVLGSLVFYGYALYQVAQLSKQADRMSERQAGEQTRLVRLSNEFARQHAGQTLADELKRLETQAKAQQAVLMALKNGVIGNTEGYSEYMRAFARQSINGLWITAFDIAGNGSQMSLSGAVVNPKLVPSYIQRLGNEKVMHGKTFSALRIQQPKDDGGRAVPRYVEFTLRSVVEAPEVKQ